MSANDLVIRVSHYRITFSEKSNGECDVTAQHVHDDDMKWETPEPLAAHFYSEIRSKLEAFRSEESVMNVLLTAEGLIVEIEENLTLILYLLPPKTFDKYIETETFVIHFSLTLDTFTVRASEKSEVLNQSEALKEICVLLPVHQWRWQYARIRSDKDHSELIAWLHSSKVTVVQKKDDTLQVGLRNNRHFVLKPVETPLLSFVQFDDSTGYVVELDRRDTSTMTVTVYCNNDDMYSFQCTRKQHPLQMQLFEAGAKHPSVRPTSVSCVVIFENIQTFVCDEKGPRSLLNISHREKSDIYVIDIELTRETMSVTVTEQNNVWTFDRPRLGTDWSRLTRSRDRVTMISSLSLSRLSITKGEYYLTLEKVAGDDPKIEGETIQNLRHELAQLKEKLNTTSNDSQNL